MGRRMGYSAFLRRTLLKGKGKKMGKVGGRTTPRRANLIASKRKKKKDIPPERGGNCKERGLDQYQPLDLKKQLRPHSKVKTRQEEKK